MVTTFDFELPRGYVDDDGVVHKRGTMRLATARDELLPLSDMRVKNNPAYLSVVLLSRVVTRLGTIDDVYGEVIENLFASGPRLSAGPVPPHQPRGSHARQRAVPLVCHTPSRWTWQVVQRGDSDVRGRPSV